LEFTLFLDVPLLATLSDFLSADAAERLPWELPDLAALPV
jgi:hypothetical protein